MNLDARTLREDHTLEAELCIVGAGPAGITLAREFAGAGVRVLLLESGGLAADPAAQALNEGPVHGDPYAGLRATRHRQAGGAVHLWNTPVGAGMGAKYTPLDAADFEPRAGLPLSGWPFPRAHLEPFYRRAQAVCGLGQFAYDAAAWTAPGRAPLPLAGEHLTTKIYQFGLGRVFAQSYLRELAAASNVSLCCYASVAGLETDGAAERVEAARVVTPSGARLRVRAQVFVLAAGAIENARLLLLSDENSPGGLGNRHGWVGRCFMEHPRDSSLVLLPRDAGLFDAAAFYDPHAATDGAMVMGRLALREEALRAQPLANMSVTLLPLVRRASAGARLLQALRLRRGPPTGHGWSSWPDKPGAYEGFRLLMNVEQMPDPENRVTLGARRDALGMPQAELEWRWGARDQANLERLRALVTEALEGDGLGRVVAAPAPPDPNAHHHAGTTRMSVDPREGVCDADGRVHGVSNLYVTGASLFPTAGFANPTLTIVALALRLAEHLGARSQPSLIM